MSYRELRNFTELMRALGYPRIISMENFRKPNFELVADILYWMVKLYDPDTTISDRVEFENERVEFLTGIAALMATKARVKLNTKKLYASDGRAVQELLKVATLLYKATRSVTKSHEDEPIPPPIKVQDVKAARVLASEITQSGAKLFDLLANETTERSERVQAMRFLDVAGASHEGSREHAFVERSIRDLIDQTKQAVEDMKKECEELEADERNIEGKIKKKKEEFERTEKRLRNLENVRPQFMDEVEKLEKELQRYYEIYVEKYRNMDYLEHELNKFHRNEEERKEEHEKKLKKMRERLLKEEVELLRGGRSTGGDEDEYTGGRGGGSGGRSVGGPSTNVRSGGGGKLGSRVQGSMKGHSDESSDGGDDEDGISQGSGEGRGSEDEDGDLSVGSRDRDGGGRRRGSSDAGSDGFIDDDEDDDDDDGGDSGEYSGGSDEDF